ncbi:MAG: hypothetical protein KOO62_07960 [candidate division Zixibacteria bacterium]|nr:hypothetical protein [candidate division Zixibacteria bacterium]
MAIRSQKAEATAFLRNRDRTGLLEWARSVRGPLRALISITFDPVELMRWRAIEAVGWVVATFAESNLDRVRDMLRRLFWQMNDESGGLAWHAPELIGEILVNVPVLIPEYADLLLSSLREEPFERGVHLAIYRIAQIDSKPFAERASELANSVASPDPIIRAFSALTLGELKASAYCNILKPLIKDQSQLRHYDFNNGDFVTLRISEAARTAVEMIESKDRAA